MAENTFVTMTEQWLASVSEAEGASELTLDAAAAQLPFELPSDYRAVMRRANGGSREFGSSWIVLWRVEDLVESNAAYRVQEFAPGFTFFGSNGGGEAYAWDRRDKNRVRYVVIPFISPEADTAVPCGETFEEFLQVLHEGIPFEKSGQLSPP